MGCYWNLMVGMIMVILQSCSGDKSKSGTLKIYVIIRLTQFFKRLIRERLTSTSLEINK